MERKYIFITGITIIIFYVIGLITYNKNYLSFLIIIILLLGAYMVKESIFEIKIFLMFLLLYPYNLLRYLIFNKKLSVYTEFYKYNYLYKTGLTMFLFYAFLFVSLGIIKKDLNYNLFNRHKKSRVICCICIIIILYLMLTGVKGTLGNYSQIILTPKIEYMIVPYIILCFFSYENLKQKIGIIFLIYSIYILACGSRVPALFLIFTVIIVNKKLFIKFRNNIGLIFIILGIFLMKIVENTRNSGGIYYEKILEIFDSKTHVIINNEADVIYAGAALIGLVEKNIFTSMDMIKTWIFMFFDIFRINIYNKDLTIPIQVLEKTNIGGGGVLNVQLFYLGKEILIIIIAIFIGINIKNLFLEKRKTYKDIYSLVILITVFRWYPYASTTLYKMGIYALIFYFFVLQIDMNLVKKILKKEEGNINN